jgi:hypothetical protein
MARNPEVVAVPAVAVRERTLPLTLTHTTVLTLRVVVGVVATVFLATMSLEMVVVGA